MEEPLSKTRTGAQFAVVERTEKKTRPVTFQVHCGTES